MPRVAPCPDVRASILEAATRLLERYGYKKMTIDDLAQEVGIGKATIYGYFDNKQEVALTVIDGYQRNIQDRWNEILVQDTTIEHRLRQMLMERVLMAFDTASRYQQSIDECLSALRPAVKLRRSRYVDAQSAILAKVLEEGSQAGIFHCEDCLHVAKTLLLSFSGLMPYSLSSKELTQREEISRQTTDLTDLLLIGLYARKTDSRANAQPL